MKNLLINNLIFFYLFFSVNTVIGQNDSNRNIQYRKIVDMDFQNDSVANYINKLKTNLQIAESKKSDIQIADNNLFIAMIYFTLNSYDIAIKYNMNALKKYEDVKDTLFIIHSLQLLSALHGNKGSNIAALEYSKRNITLCKILGDSLLLSRSYLNLGAGYGNMGKDKLAIEYFKKSIKYSPVNIDKHLLTNIYLNIGEAYIRINQLNNSEYYHNKTFSLIENKNSSIASLFSQIAEVAFLRKNYSKAIFNSKQSLKYYDNKIMTGDASSSYLILIKSLIKKRNSSEVIKYLESFEEYRKKITEKRNLEQFNKMKILYEIDKYETEIKLLSKENKLLLTENELRESKIIASKQKLYFAGFIIFATLLIMVIIIIQNSRLKKTQKKIVEENVKSLKFEEENIQLQKVISNEQKAELELSDSNSGKDQNSLLFSQAVNLLENEKLYKNPELKMSSLAKRLDTNTSYLSKAINSVSNKSFSEFVNEYRVAEAKKMLFGKESELLTIEAIGKKAGFNSKTTFFRVFKLIAGVTPNFFLNNIKSKK